jgi:cytochrome P450
MRAAGEQDATGTVDGDSKSRLPSLEEILNRTGPFDLPPGLAELSARGPVHEAVTPDGDSIWVVCRYAEARAVLSDPRFSSNRFRAVNWEQLTDEQRKVVGDETLRVGAFITNDAPQHTRYRRLLTGHFTMRRMRQHTLLIDRIVTEQLDKMLAAGSPADLVTDFAMPVPARVICGLLGVPYAARTEFGPWTSVALRLDASIDEMHEATAWLREFMLDLVRRKRTEPGDDLITALLDDHEACPPLTDLEVANMAKELFIGGLETTESMLTLGTLILLEHPEQLQALRDDPALVDGAVEELLRYATIVRLGMFRVTVEDVELAGVNLPAGSVLLISPMAANRDAGRWPDPAALDLTRASGQHLAFGHGAHQCLGQQLARAEMTTAFTHLLRRVPGLRLAVPAAELPFRENMAIYGVDSLPVAWDAS